MYRGPDSWLDSCRTLYLSVVLDWKIGQNYSHYLGQNYSHHLGQNYSHYLGQNYSHHLGQNYSHHLGQNYSHHLGQNYSHHLGQNYSHHLGQNYSHYLCSVMLVLCIIFYMLEHTWFNPYAPKFVPMVYYRNKTWVQMNEVLWPFCLEF